MADPIFIEMAKFDFSAPVETITFYEEDMDEENRPPLKKIKLEDKNITDNPSECLNPEEKVIDSVDSENELQRVTIKVNDCVIEYNLADVNKASKSQQFTNTEDVTKRYNTNINRKETENSNVTVTEESLPDQVNTVSSPNNNNVNNNQRQNSDMKVISSYLKKLMDTVSEYLIIILRAQRIYLHVRKTGNHNEIEKWKEHYMQVKYHYFKLAFTIVETIFIPQVKLCTFARSFIECTIRLASKKLFTCTYEQIEPLYMEMLEWTKEKSRKFKNFALSYITTYFGILKKKSPTESTNRLRNMNSQHLQQSSVQTFINNRSRQNAAGDNQHRYPVLESMIRPNIPNYEESVRSQDARNPHYHNAINNNYGWPRINSCDNNGYYNYQNRSHTGYVSRPLSEPSGSPNCVYCQQSQQWNATRQQNRPLPVTSQVPTMDLR